MKTDSLWNKVLGHQDVITRLTSAMLSNKVSHAYLFFGPDGIGKHYVATLLAAALNCENDNAPCGHCRSCQATLHKRHHETRFIEPEGTQITIDQIRGLRRQINLKIVGVNKKIFIIDEAQTMNNAAANSFLKVLEDPPPDVVFILIANALEALPATIISRCQLLKFNKVPSNTLKEYLVSNYSLGDDSASVIASLSQGSTSNAQAMATDTAMIEERKKIISTLLKINEASLSTLMGLAGEIISDVASRKKVLQEIQTDELKDAKKIATDSQHLLRINKELGKKHKRALAKLERRAFSDILDYLNSYYRDALLIASGADSKMLVNIDVRDEIAEAAKTLSVKSGIEATSYIKEAKERLISNVSPSLTLETLFFKLQEAS